MDDKRRLENAKRMLEYATDEIDRLTKNAAADAKPELRHGDYGYRGGTAFLYINNRTSPDTAYYAGGSFCTNFTENDHDHELVILGNIFDDLAQLQEEVEEFTLGDDLCENRTTLDGSSVLIKAIDDGECVRIQMSHLPETILNLQKMYATHQRKQELSQG